jgi:hypothetical protein
MNYWLGTEAEFDAWIGNTPAPQPVAQPYKIWAPLITNWAKGQGYSGPDPDIN